MRYHEIVESIPGLPPEIELHPVEKERLGDRYRLTGSTRPRTRWRYTDSHDVQIHPSDAEHATPYQRRAGKPDLISYYDPALSDLVDYNEDEPLLARKGAVPKPHLTHEIEPLPDPDLMYRGMSFEEFQNFLKTGIIQSRGEYNFKGQEGLTYWATTPATAAYYGNAFAPTKFKPTFTRPAYVVAARRPDRTVHVPGTGENEIGVPGPTHRKDVVAAWEGRVYNFETGEYTLTPSRYNDDPLHTLGGGSSPSISVVWQRIPLPKDVETE